jgi:hypothetical protein
MTHRRKTMDKEGPKFVDSARALECDESEERFDTALKKIATHKPPRTRLPNLRETPFHKFLYCEWLFGLL